MIKRGIICILIFVLAITTFGSTIQIPKPEKITLENGISVYYRFDSELPLVSYRLVIRGAGTAFEPQDMEGISDFTATLVMRGTMNKTAEQISEELDFMGPVRLRDVEESQMKVVEIVRMLEEDGEIVVSGRGGAEEIVA